jgi:hypothetical protein
MVDGISLLGLAQGMQPGSIGAPAGVQERVRPMGQDGQDQTLAF